MRVVCFFNGMRSNEKAQNKMKKSAEKLNKS